MDQNYGAKYFLDLNFQQDPSVNREKLRLNYVREITNLFRPYIQNATLPKQYPTIQDTERPSPSH